jgi:hypothetical protein
MLKSGLTCAVAVLCLTAAAFSQQPAAKKARTVPAAAAVAAVADSEQTFIMFEGNMLAVRYSPPAMKGRKIFGGAVPYGQVWRIGEKGPVTLHAEADMQFNGFSLFKGDYTVYMLVDADSWQLILNRQTGAKAAVYDPKLDMGRVKMTLAKAPAPIETCKITLTKTADLAGKLEVAWENTVASIPFYLDRVAVDKEW